MAAQRTIRNTQELGRVVRAVRKSQGVRQDDTAGSIGVSENFLAKVEHGGERAQLGKVLQVLHELGIEIVLKFPESAQGMLQEMESRA